MDNDRNVQLNERDFGTLLLCLGYAMASAQQAMNYDLAERFTNLANRNCTTFMTRPCASSKRPNPNPSRRRTLPKLSKPRIDDFGL